MEVIVRVDTMTVEERINRLVQGKQYREALSLLAPLCRTSNPFWALKMAGIVSHELGQFRESATHLEKALAVHPDDPEANLFMASAYYSLGQYSRAGVCLQVVYRQQKNNYHALRLLSLISLAEGRVGEALQYTSEMVKYWENDMDASLFHGQALQDSGRAEDAVRYYDRVIGQYS